MEIKTRYFIVMFELRGGDYIPIKNMICTSKRNGKYPSFHEIEKQAKNGNDWVDNVSITNIIELTELDFNDFTLGSGMEKITIED